MEPSGKKEIQKTESQITRRTILKGGVATGILLSQQHFASARRPAFLFEENVVSISTTSMSCNWLDEPLGIQDSQPRLAWSFVNPVPGLRQAAYQIIAGSNPNGVGDLWDSGRVDSPAAFALYRGRTLKPHESAFWRVRIWLSSGQALPWSEFRRWSIGPLSEYDWGASRWIGRDDTLEKMPEVSSNKSSTIAPPEFLPAPYLRKEFATRTDVKSAFLYASGLGYAELHLNGERIGDTERDPGYTNFSDRVLYVTHDITRSLKPGPNALGAILGTGWYDVHDLATWRFDRAAWRRRPRLRLVIAIEYQDGQREMIVSDESWCCASGPILRDGIYTGEFYDARKEMPGWNTAGFDAEAWQQVVVVDAPAGKLVPLTWEPVRITNTLVPIAVHQAEPGVYIVDMGQNFSGHVQLRVKGPAGQAITMRYAEKVDSRGMLDTDGIDQLMTPTHPSQPFQQDTYILKGSVEEEVWEQRFSYAGFRYIEVTGFPGAPTVDNFRGRFAHTDLKRAGVFTCSDETMNRIQRATLWSFLSNAQSIPTDCPQREKNGWTGDAGLAVECGLTNFRSQAFYLKWLDDFADAQRKDGGFPEIIPTWGWGNEKITPAWDVAYPLIVWNFYLYTGDRRVIERHKDSVRRYVEFFLSQRGTDGLTPSFTLGDWLPWRTETPTDYLTNAYLYYDLTLLGKILEASGDIAAAKHYASLAGDMADAIHRAFYDPANAIYANGSQTSQSTALYFGLVPSTERPRVFAQLVDQVTKLGHIDTGILGAKHLLRALSEGGRTDLAFQIATQKKMPGWGYWVNEGGATTLWEQWKGTDSRNHIMFGDISAWAYQWLGGLQQDTGSIGYRKILFRPAVFQELIGASASRDTPNGKASIEWKLNRQSLKLTVEVPCGSTARVQLPAPWRLHARNAGAERMLPSGTHTLYAHTV